MRRDVTRDRQPGGLRRSDQVQGRRGGDVCQVQARAGLIRQDVREDSQIPPDRGRLGRCRPSAQPKHRRYEALVRFGA